MNNISVEDLNFEREHVWHPYSAIPNLRQVLPVVAAEGVTLTLNDGTRLIDAVSSWWCMAHGHNVAPINDAIRDQLNFMSHVMFGGLTHAPAIELTKMILEFLPPQLNKVFYADSGSIAVEVALKMVLEYFQGIGRPEKNRFMTVRGGYHGDTLGTMAFCDPAEGMHSTLQNVLTRHIFAPRPQCKFSDPWCEESMAEVKTLIECHHHETAAFIIEPVMQGAGGMYFYHPQYLVELSKLCREYNILLIFDEIATGFYRTGVDFAMNYAQTVPDILCLGKALTGGAITLAATICSDKIAGGVSSGKPGVLLHGPTFMANPLACRAAIESLRIFKHTNYTDKVKKIETQLRIELEKCRNLELVKEVRVLGAVGVVELKKPAPPELQQQIVKRGVWLRPFGNVLYTMPPFIISETELTQVTDSMFEALKYLENSFSAKTQEYV